MFFHHFAHAAEVLLFHSVDDFNFFNFNLIFVNIRYQGSLEFGISLDFLLDCFIPCSFVDLLNLDFASTATFEILIKFADSQKFFDRYVFGCCPSVIVSLG